MRRANWVLFLIALVLAIPTVLTLRSERVAFASFEDSQLLLAGFTRANVRAFGISVPRFDARGELVRDERGQALRSVSQFARTNDGWMLADVGAFSGIPVPEEMVFDRVLRHLESIRRDEKALVAVDASPAELARYGLDEEHAVEIRCVDGQGNMLAELLVGKDASAGRLDPNAVRAFFVRTRDSSDVVLYEQDHWLLDPTPATWFDKKPLDIAVDEVVRVRLLGPRGEFEVRRNGRDDWDWQKTIGPEEAGAPFAAEIRGLIQAIAGLEIADYREPVAQLTADPAVLSQRGLSDPMIRAEVELADGTSHVVDVGFRLGSSNEYWLRISTVGFVMTVGDWMVSRLDRDPMAYFGPAASKTGGNK